MVGVNEDAFAGKSDRRPLAPTFAMQFPVGARLAREAFKAQSTRVQAMTTASSRPPTAG